MIIGADGLRSLARKLVVDDGDPIDAGRTIWRGVMPLDESVVEAKTCWMSAGEGKVGFINDIGEGLMYWSAFGTDDALEAEITADLRSSVMSLTGEQPRTSKMPPALRQKTASGKRRR